MKSDGAGAKMLYVRGPASSPAQLAEAEGFCVIMDGPEVFKFAVRAMEDVSRQAVKQAGLCMDDIACVIPHQANQRIISSFVKGLGLPMERVFLNVERYGNTYSASIPVALCEAWEEGRLNPGDNLLFVAVGGGLSWGAAVMQWTGLGQK
jgi:3-oxoacyl-[acyl-carrier-protein] synthase-3